MVAVEVASWAVTISRHAAVTIIARHIIVTNVINCVLICGFTNGWESVSDHSKVDTSFSADEEFVRIVSDVRDLTCFNQVAPICPCLKAVG